MILYTVQRSIRAQHLRITIQRDGSVVVTVPYSMKTHTVQRFIEEKKIWIEKKVNTIKTQYKKTPQPLLPKGTKKDLEKNKSAALNLIHTRLSHFNTYYNFNWNNVSVKNVRTRWGSCSKIGNLNFSYKILYLSPEIADYLIVHELCHLGEFNHSPAFWTLVEKTIPNFSLLRKKLRGLD